MNVILIDHKSDKVLEVIELSEANLKKLSKDENLPYKAKSDLYIFKELLSSDKSPYSLIKVKQNKNSSFYNDTSIFGEDTAINYKYLENIEQRIGNRIQSPKRKNHVNNMFKKGVDQIAKKFGEESVELIIESKKNSEKGFRNEAADVLYYFLILIHERGYKLDEIAKQLKKQNRNF